ncbi:hypothetical protein AB0N17_43900 [Streptomyces sp. NPDC051133]|uniref:hypothetical protein n=1 Tax=Streptomyces sp. NPDC051133 TaxID=3155521 RepID=UPI00342A2C83
METSTFLCPEGTTVDLGAFVPDVGTSSSLSFAGATVDLTERSTVNGPVTDFVVHGPFAAVSVGLLSTPFGDENNAYSYAPAGIGADDSVHTPFDPNNPGQYYSAADTTIEFCLIPSSYNDGA